MAGELSDWATHLPVLLAACAGTTDEPILECGCGHNSTPMLHALCAPRRRSLFTLDGNESWLRLFRDLEQPWHQLVHVPNWDEPPIFRDPDHSYAVAFVDHDKAPRGPLVGMLQHQARYVVMHDSETHYCDYGPHLATFKWVWTFKKYETWTSIASMWEPPAWLAEALSPGEWGIPVPYRG